MLKFDFGFRKPKVVECFKGFQVMYYPRVFGLGNVSMYANGELRVGEWVTYLVRPKAH